MGRKNILFVSLGIYPCKIGGAEIFNYYLLDNLKNKINVILLTNCTYEFTDINVIRVFNIKPRRILNPLQILLIILNQRKNIDLIHLSYMRAPWIDWIIYPIIKKIINKPYMVTIHGGSLQKWKPFKVYQWFFKNAKTITGVSVRICEEYSRRIARDVVYIPPLIPFQMSKRSKDDIKKDLTLTLNSKIILYVGSIKAIKGTDTLVKAFIKIEEIFKNQNNLILLIAGNGEKRTYLEELAQSEISKNKIRFLGNVERFLIPDLYKIADYYIISSLYEGTSMSLLEAMFNKLPIIGADSPGINNILVNEVNSLLFEPNNEECLREKLIRIVSEKELACRLSQKAFNDFTLNYNYDTMLSKYFELFEKVKSDK